MFRRLLALVVTAIVAVLVPLGAAADEPERTPTTTSSPSSEESPLLHTSGTAIDVDKYEVSSTSPGWTDTELVLQPGEAVFIAPVSGSWTVDFRNFPRVNANGYPPKIDQQIYQGCKEDPSLRYGQLLARVGSGNIIAISQSNNLVFSSYAGTGTLSLKINDADGCLADNDGALIVQASLYLMVQHETQIGSNPTDPKTGGNNCGPTVLAMAINFFEDQRVVTPTAAANYVRTHDFSGRQRRKQGGTNFGLDDSPTGVNSRDLLGLYDLTLNRVYNFDDVRREINAGHPVIVLVDNHQYRKLAGYESDSDGFFTKWHIVLVVGYDQGVVYVRDPLRKSSADLMIPLSTFKLAADAANGGAWYAASVTPSS